MRLYDQWAKRLGQARYYGTVNDPDVVLYRRDDGALVMLYMGMICLTAFPDGQLVLAQYREVPSGYMPAVARALAGVAEVTETAPGVWSVAYDGRTPEPVYDGIFIAPRSQRREA